MFSPLLFMQMRNMLLLCLLLSPFQCLALESALDSYSRQQFARFAYAPHARTGNKCSTPATQVTPGPGWKRLRQFCAWHGRLRATTWIAPNTPHTCLNHATHWWAWAKTRYAAQPDGKSPIWDLRWQSQSLQREDKDQRWLGNLEFLHGQWLATEWVWQEKRQASGKVRWRSDEAEKWDALRQFSRSLLPPAALAQVYERELPGFPGIDKAGDPGYVSPTSSASALSQPESMRVAKLLAKAWSHLLAGRAAQLGTDGWRWQAESLCLHLLLEMETLFPLAPAVEDSRTGARNAIQVQLTRLHPRAHWIQTFHLLDAEGTGVAQYMAIWRENHLLRAQLWQPQESGSSKPSLRFELRAILAASSAPIGSEQEKLATGILRRELDALARGLRTGVP